MLVAIPLFGHMEIVEIHKTVHYYYYTHCQWVGMGSAALAAAVHPHKETPNTGSHTTVRTYRNSGNL